MFKICLTLAISILFYCGCDAPSKSGSNESSDTGQAKQQKPESRLKPKTVKGVKLEPTHPISCLEILIPKGFTEMDDAVIATKYPSSNRPNLVYTNENGTINIAINHTKNKISPKQMRQLHVQLDSSIRQAQPNAKWMFSGTQIHHGRTWAQLEFQSNAVDSKIHNMMMATSAQGRMLAISVNFTDEHAESWAIVGRNIVDSALVTE